MQFFKRHYCCIAPGFAEQIESSQGIAILVNRKSLGSLSAAFSGESSWVQVPIAVIGQGPFLARLRVLLSSKSSPHC